MDYKHFVATRDTADRQRSLNRSFLMPMTRRRRRYQGNIQEYELVLTSSDLLAIVGADGTVAWESTRDDLCAEANY